ncbi:MAG TPA: hypothetical protein VF546_24230 [Pyrinomonadaceae bacterium]|jgi:hypothetical protein
MVTKKKPTAEKEVKEGRVKVGKLKLDKEGVKDLTGGEARRVKGGGGLSGVVCKPVDPNPTSFCSDGQA